MKTINKAQQFFNKEIKRTNKNHAILCIVFTLAFFFVIYAVSDSIVLNFSKPVLLSTNELDFKKQVSNIQTNRYYELKDSRLEDTNLGVYADLYMPIGPYFTNKRVSVDIGKLYTVKIGKRYLLVYIHEEKQKQSIIGILEPMHSKLKDFIRNNTLIFGNNLYYPYTFSTSPSTDTEFYFNLSKISIFFIIAIVLWLRLFIRIRNPLSHPNYKTLPYYGKPNEVAEEINNDLIDMHFENGKRILKTDKWIVSRKLFKTIFNKIVIHKDE